MIPGFTFGGMDSRLRGNDRGGCGNTKEECPPMITMVSWDCHVTSFLAMTKKERGKDKKGITRLPRRYAHHNDRGMGRSG